MFRAASAARIASRSLQRKPPARRSYGSVPAANYTPMEEMMLDATAWFVASAIVLAPEHECDDLDYQNLKSREKKMEQDGEKEKKKPPK
jgi:hypothetical protein